MLRLAWAVSGQGRALEAVMDAIEIGLVHAEVVCVITDRPSPIEKVAGEREIPWHRLEPEGARFHPKLVDILTQYAPDWLGLTFNRLLADDVLAFLHGRILNLHMSLLPMFPGFGALGRTLDAGMRVTGATIHLVDGTTDQGLILGQAACPVAAKDTRAMLGERLFRVSLPLLLQILRSIGRGDLTYDEATGLTWPRLDTVAETSGTFPACDADLVAFARTYCDRLRLSASPRAAAFGAQ